MSDQTHASATSSLAAIEARIRTKDFAGALDQVGEQLAQGGGDSTELLYMQAVCQRYLALDQEALATLDQLKLGAPNHGRAHQEEGHTYRDRGDRDAALLAYRRATQLNPALIASWQAQHRLLSQAGQSQAATLIQQQLERLQQLPPPLLAVTDLISQGRLIKAEAVSYTHLTLPTT